MESVVLLDEAGNASGTAGKVAVHHDRTPLHLAFSCYLFNEAGQFLLTRRAESKRTFPGVWTNTCCGHPLPGEATSDGVLRRLRDELGIVRKIQLLRRALGDVPAAEQPDLRRDQVIRILERRLALA